MVLDALHEVLFNDLRGVVVRLGDGGGNGAVWVLLRVFRGGGGLGEACLGTVDVEEEVGAAI